MASDVIFEPLNFRNLTVKNRIFRSNTYGNFNDPDGIGTPERIAWEEKFARGGVGAILSSVVPVAHTGRMAPNCPTLHEDDRIPFWRKVAETVHHYNCKYIVQLSYGGSHLGLLSAQITPDGIQEIIQDFADAARRSREAGLDGVEIDATSGGTGQFISDLTQSSTKPPVNLIAQFLRGDVNPRTDDYGQSLENRCRFLIEVVKAIRQQVGDDFHLQIKIERGENLEEDIQIAQNLETAGADALHAGSKVPQSQPSFTDFPLDIQGPHLDATQRLKQAVNIPVLCTGGFQTASYIRHAIAGGYCDGVTLARALIANSNLVHLFAQGDDSPERPCSYCEKCRINLIDNPLGCYDVTRYEGDYGEMIREMMSVYLHPGK